MSIVNDCSASRQGAVQGRLTSFFGPAVVKSSDTLVKKRAADAKVTNNTRALFSLASSLSSTLSFSLSLYPFNTYVCCVNDSFHFCSIMVQARQDAKKAKTTKSKKKVCYYYWFLFENNNIYILLL